MITNTLEHYEHYKKQLNALRTSLIKDKPLNWQLRIEFISGQLSILEIALNDLKLIRNHTTIIGEKNDK